MDELVLDARPKRPPREEMLMPVGVISGIFIVVAAIIAFYGKLLGVMWMILLGLFLAVAAVILMTVFVVRSRMQGNRPQLTNEE